METLIDLFVRLPEHLKEYVAVHGDATYILLFVIIFAETGLVVTPFLPGDSLLFAAGALAAMGSLSAGMTFGVLVVAAVLGNTVNYWVGYLLGPRIVRGGGRRLIKQKHLDRTHAFFEKYGGKTVIITRFVPILRTMAPFVAGVGAMSHARFQVFNVIGAVMWVGICVYAGVFFGEREFVKKNFSVVAIAIVFISVLPAVIEYLLHRRRAKQEVRNAGASATTDMAADQLD